MRLVRAGAYAAALVALVAGAARLEAQTYFGQNQVQYDRFKWTVLETEHCLAFHDINPLAPIHVLVIPKGPYVSWDDFSEKASVEEIVDFTRTIGEVARQVGADAQGYRVLSNVGKRSGQEVPHLHVHVFGGAPLGPMLAR